MPEMSLLIDCKTKPDDPLAKCKWNETRWRAVHPDGPPVYPMGFASIRDPGYYLRPEAIESLFILYRITGKPEFQDAAWRMFGSMVAATQTAQAYSGVVDVRAPAMTEKTNSMESFWLAETLKYFYLIFSEPTLLSLDDWVFNTEAHPFRILKIGKGELRKGVVSS
jgi:mannosyl-oligosaccharide alpha-1,2-mannosidase